MNAKNTNDGLILLCCLFIVLAVASRLVPHPMSFTPIGAIGLFSGAYLTNRYAWLVPIMALLVGDFFIGFYDPLVMLFVYGGFAMSAVIGRIFLSKKRTVFRVFGSAVSSATIFFVLSNFGLWLSGQYYPMTLAGLTECFILAIPFYGNTLLGDLFYASVLFGTFEMIRSWVDKDTVSAV